MDAREFPFREIVNINKDFQIVVWRDNFFYKVRYDLAQRIGENEKNGSTKWQVRASFVYPNEFFKYISGLNLENL